MAKLKFTRHPKKKGEVRHVEPKKFGQHIQVESMPEWKPIPKEKPISDQKKEEDITTIIDKKLGINSEHIATPEKKNPSLYEAYKQSHDVPPSPEKTKVKTIKEQMPKKEDMAKFVVREAKMGINWSRTGLYLCALGMVGIIFFSQMANDINPAFVLLIWLFGMMCFLPLGFIGGWMFLDPYMRCKLYRRFRGGNYGIVNFLHKGGQRIITRIKNLDDDVIIENGRMWLLDKEGIHYIDKNNEKKLWKKIDVEHMKTLPANVPCLFLDPETMSPIKFIEEPSKTNPQQAGAVILGYINNQARKGSMLKKGSTIIFIIILGAVILNLVLGIQLYMWIEEINTVLPALRHQISTMADLLAQYNPPVP